MGHLLRWKRKWAIIHNTASLKTSIRWNLLSLLLIAWYSQCHWEAFIFEPIYLNILKKIWVFTSCYHCNTCSVTPQTLENVYSCTVQYISSFINACSCLHSHCTLDMGELSLTREGYSSYLGVPQELKVRAGDDVVVKCSASSSEEPSYYWQKEVRKPWECEKWQCPHFAFGNLSFCLPALSLHFWCDLFIFLPISLQSIFFLLPLFKHSFNSLSSLNTSVFLSLTSSNYLFPLNCCLSIPSTEEVLCL